MKMSETRELYNRRAMARLTRALPDIFPAPVLVHALSRRWTPAMPRISRSMRIGGRILSAPIASRAHWHARVARRRLDVANRIGCRIARVLLDSTGTLPRGEIFSRCRLLLRLRPARLSLRLAQGPVECRPKPSRNLAHGLRRSVAVVERLRVHMTGCCGGFNHFDVRRPDGVFSRQPRSTTTMPLFRVWREQRDTPWPALLGYWGVPNLQVINREAHAAKCAVEANYRRERAISARAI